MRRMSRFIHLHVIKNRATSNMKRKLKRGCNKHIRRVCKFLLSVKDFEDTIFETQPYYSELDVG